MAQQPAEVDGVPLELRLESALEPLKLPDPVVAGGIAVWLVPAVGLFDSPLLLVPGEVPPASEPHGRPSASVRPVLFSVPAVEGLVPIVPGVVGVIPGV